MTAFATWLDSLVGKTDTPVFVGFNAPFDWSFINYYFHKFIGRNPFGFAALDIKAYYMGATGCSWRETRCLKAILLVALETRRQAQCPLLLVTKFGGFARRKAL